MRGINADFTIPGWPAALFKDFRASLCDNTQFYLPVMVAAVRVTIWPELTVVVVIAISNDVELPTVSPDATTVPLLSSISAAAATPETGLAGSLGEAH